MPEHRRRRTNALNRIQRKINRNFFQDDFQIRQYFLDRPEILDLDPRRILGKDRNPVASQPSSIWLVLDVDLANTFRAPEP